MRSGLCYMCSLDTCFNVYKNNNALWLVLLVFARHVLMCTKITMRSGLCYLCSLDTFFNVYNNNNAL
jgi:hypothetical protein